MKFTSVSEAAMFYLKRWGKGNTQINRLTAWVTKNKKSLPIVNRQGIYVDDIMICNSCANVLSKWRNGLIRELDAPGFVQHDTEGDICLAVASVFLQMGFRVRHEVSFHRRMGSVDLLIYSQITHLPILIIEVKNNDSWSAKRQAETQCQRYQDATGVRAKRICCKYGWQAKQKAGALACSLT